MAIGILGVLFAMSIVGAVIAELVFDANFCGLWSGAFQAISNALPFGGNFIEVPCPWPF
jgi:hypothetical protein